MKTLKVGDHVIVQWDSGELMIMIVSQEPWQLGDGEWVVGLGGFRGGYLLSRVKGKLGARGLCCPQFINEFHSLPSTPFKYCPYCGSPDPVSCVEESVVDSGFDREIRRLAREKGVILRGDQVKPQRFVALSYTRKDDIQLVDIWDGEWDPPIEREKFPQYWKDIHRRNGDQPPYPTVYVVLEKYQKAQNTIEHLWKKIML